MKKRNIKSLVGLILLLGSIIGILACVIASIVFSFKNIDMTSMRRLIEYPQPTIWVIICWIVGNVGKSMLKD